MKYLLWTTFGLICGAALGLATPILLTMYFMWRHGAAANGIGTPMALLTIATVPGGALFGAYVGWRRANTGRWKGTFSATANPDMMNLFEVLAIKRRFPFFHEETTRMTPDQSRVAQQTYVRNLYDDYESSTLNTGLVAVWVLVGLMLPPLLIVPAVISAKYLLTKKLLRDHLREVIDRWSLEKPV